MSAETRPIPRGRRLRSIVATILVAGVSAALAGPGNEVRWRSGARTWREATISVPDPDVLSEGPLPAEIASGIYPADEKPVFFGHYWLEGLPRIEAANALCLDYSAGIGENPLYAYAWRPELPVLVTEAIVGGRDDAGGIAEAR